MAVDFKHKDLSNILPDYDQITDCLAGQRAVKAKGDVYLPRPNVADTSTDNRLRFSTYVQRASFHNVTACTVSNMVGQCFSVPPVPTLPPEMEKILENIDGGGVSATQQSKKALTYVCSLSRAGLWTDYPKQKEDGTAISKLEEEEGGIRPKIILIHPSKIINWRVTEKGAETKLSLVVIEENYIAEDDGFEALTKTQYRVLRLKDDLYSIEVYRQGEKGDWGKSDTMGATPTKGDGSKWNEIPFVFLGAEENTPEVEKPLILDISNLNIKHYQNSADYEELVYLCGQPTLVMTGLTQNWIDTNMKGAKAVVGARAGIMLPKDGDAKYLQVNEATLPKEAMEQKEKQMVALGAKLVEQSKVAKTATESGINEASETSILAACCNNVSNGYGKALRWCAMYSNIQVAEPDKDILFELNTDFAISRMTPEEQTAVIALMTAQLITFEEARDKLRNGGIAYLSDEDAKDQLEQQAEEDLAKGEAELAQQTSAQIAVQDAKAKATPPPAAA